MDEQVSGIAWSWRRGQMVGRIGRGRVEAFLIETGISLHPTLHCALPGQPTLTVVLGDDEGREKANEYLEKFLKEIA